MRQGLTRLRIAGMIITIDGPAGTGKSSVAHALAERLGFDFLDTGAMYRAVGFACLRHGADMNNARELAYCARRARVEFDWSMRPPGVLLNDEPIGHLLRGSEATQAASHVAQVPAIREQLVQAQQRIGLQRPDLVTEGRDQGTVVFPDARLKFYLDAAPQERARRRVAQLHSRGEVVDYQETLNQIVTRDARDAARSMGPLAVPRDAQVIDTTQLTQQEVVDSMVARIEQVISGPTATARGNCPEHVEDAGGAE